MTVCYLCIHPDNVHDGSAARCESIKYAVDEYRAYVEDVGRFQDTFAEASIHIPDNSPQAVAREPREADRLVEDPDYVLSAGPRGGIRKERG